jgi:hypothetical protein
VQAVTVEDRPSLGVGAEQLGQEEIRRDGEAVRVMGRHGDNLVFEGVE